MGFNFISSNRFEFENIQSYKIRMKEKSFLSQMYNSGVII
jgi:hypothetical protein